MDSTVDPRFGRCQYFIMVDTETMAAAPIQNTGAAASGGAGMQAAQLVQDEGASCVITGNVGPNAMNVLKGSAKFFRQPTMGNNHQTNQKNDHQIY